MATYPSVEQIAEMTRLLTEATINNWLNQDLGSWRWWILVIVLIVPWLIWYKLAEKGKLAELVLVGLIVMVITITLNDLGFSLCFWSYPVKLVPVFPRLTSVDYTVMPVTYMLIYQYFPTWESSFRALVVVAAIYSFVLEPALVYFGFYVIIKWFYWRSFPIYIVMGLLSRWLASTILAITLRKREK